MEIEYGITDWADGLIEWECGGLDDIATSLLIKFKEALEKEIDLRERG
jgi:hypothetical protein